ncbi:MAG: sulfotransferase domain-containing protein [Chloroflexi bacterium]|nr:sulfotransferase domain-containing protein [Chloroflexota bacterium]
MTLTTRLKLFRRRARRAAARLRWGALDAPILFGNSFPKSGTHLLTQVLEGFAALGPAVVSGLPPVVTFDGPTGRPRPLAHILADLARFQPGDIAYGHLHAEPEIWAALCRPGVAPFFIYRDPRDVVVSHVYYVTEMEPNHVHHRHYTEKLHTFEERLQVSILGLPELDVPFPDIAGRFAPYLGWLERPEVLCLRYEDFLAAPEETLGRVSDHAARRGFRSRAERSRAIEILRARIDPKRSPTFRSGQAGGWRAHFTPEITALFKQASGDLLARLGYEEDADWA